MLCVVPFLHVITECSFCMFDSVNGVTLLIVMILLSSDMDLHDRQEMLFKLVDFKRIGELSAEALVSHAQSCVLTLLILLLTSGNSFVSCFFGIISCSSD